MAEIIIKDTNKIIFSQAVIAKTFIQRLIGLIGRSSLPDNEALVFYDANSIHMFFMRIPLDLIYLDKNLKITKLVRNIKPWSMSVCLKAKVTIEVTSNAIERNSLKLGQTLIIRHD